MFMASLSAVSQILRDLPPANTKDVVGVRLPPASPQYPCPGRHPQYCCRSPAGSLQTWSIISAGMGRDGREPPGKYVLEMLCCVYTLAEGFYARISQFLLHFQAVPCPLLFSEPGSARRSPPRQWLSNVTNSCHMWTRPPAI